MNTNDCLYCVPLLKEDIGSLDQIIALAKKPSFNSPKRYGNRGVVWPNAPSIQTAPVEIATQKAVGKLPIVPCMYNSIMVENPTHQARYYLVSWYRTLLTNNLKCYDYVKNQEVLEMIIKEIRKIASHENIWLDWDESVTKYHAEYTVTNDGGYMFPSCNKLISEGYCVGKCWRFPNVDN
jgi:hypothetical protein